MDIHFAFVAAFMWKFCWIVKSITETNIYKIKYLHSSIRDGVVL